MSKLYMLPSFALGVNGMGFDVNEYDKYQPIVVKILSPNIITILIAHKKCVTCVTSDNAMYWPGCLDASAVKMRALTTIFQQQPQ